MKNNVEEVINYIKDVINITSKQLGAFDHRQQTIESINKTFSNLLLDGCMKEFPDLKAKDLKKLICFESSIEGDVIDIVPKDLFTFLLFKRILVHPKLLEGKDSYKTDIGTFIYRDGESYFQPIKTQEHIEIEFEVKN